MNEHSKPELALFQSYVAMIQNSVGARIYKNLYFRINGDVIDVLEDGDLSCAMFVSTLLHTFGLIKELHTTVNGTIEDLLQNGWTNIDEPRKGAVVLWGFKKKDDGTQGKHRHVGFYIDEQTCISNDSDSRVVWTHHPTYGTFPSGEARRDIQAYYWHPLLDERSL